MDPKFNLLDWWRVNAPRCPVLAMMAKRFLTVPATSVSSESTFSTGGRVLDDYRSSLKPEMVEALVCGASYIKVLTRTSMWWRGMKMRRTMLRISSCPRLLMWGITTIDIHHVGVALAIFKMEVDVILSCGLLRSM